MKRQSLLFIIYYLSLIAAVQAQTRVTTRAYNPDPAPVVSGKTLYVFTGHDLDTAILPFKRQKDGRIPKFDIKLQK